MNRKLAHYLLGYVLSLAFTVVAFTLVLIHTASGHESISHQSALVLLVVLALSQFATQLYFFLHLGEEEKPRFNLAIFGYALTLVVALAGGSVWIMYNLQHNMHPRAQANVFEEENIFPSGHENH